MATTITTARTRPCRGHLDVLARHRTPTPTPVADGLTSRQSAEIARITARHGRTTWRQRPDSTVLLAVHGDDPRSGEHPTYLLLMTDGTIVRPAGLRRAS